MKDQTVAPGSLPWSAGTLGECCEIYQPKTISQKEMADDAEFPVYGANGKIGQYSKYNHADPQLLVTCRGATCGSVNISEPFSWITGNAMVIRPKTSQLNIKFVEYFFRGALDFSSVITGAAQPQITRTSLSPVEIPLPPLEEQKRIVAILDQAFAALDRARAHAEANLADAGELFGSSLAAAFFAEGDVPTKPLGSLCEFEGGSQPPKSQFVDTPRPGYIRLLQIRDFKSDEKAVYIPDDGKRRRCTADDIMIGRYGASVGQIHRGKAGAYNVALIKTIPNNEELNRDYFYYYLLSDLFQKPLLAKSSRGAQDGFNKADISPFSVPVPSILDQLRIVERLSSVEQEVSTLTKQYEEKLNDIADLRQSLLQKAFSGQLNA